MWTVGIVAGGRKFDAGLSWCVIEHFGLPGEEVVTKVIAFTEQRPDAERIAAALNEIGEGHQKPPAPETN